MKAWGHDTYKEISKEEPNRLKRELRMVYALLYYWWIISLLSLHGIKFVKSPPKHYMFKNIWDLNCNTLRKNAIVNCMRNNITLFFVHCTHMYSETMEGEGDTSFAIYNDWWLDKMHLIKWVKWCYHIPSKSRDQGKLYLFFL